jgi:hypothetical protein
MTMRTDDVFQDEVLRATDLNRGSSEVLNKAARRPVTIIRNDEVFALMRREVAAQWRKEASYAAHMTELLWNALSHPATLPPEYRWITAFDSEQTLEMTNELMTAYRSAVRSADWETFDVILHEWSESGWAALSADVQEAFRSEPDEVRIEPPVALAE